MPRTKPAARAPEGDVVDKMPSLAAAARRLTGKPDITKISRSGRGWQSQGWDFYDIIGEFRYGCDWVGNMISKATLFVAKDGTALPAGDSTEAAAYAASLFGGPESQGEMLRQLGVHLTVAGEAFIIGTESRKNGDKWLVVAATELTTRSGNWYASGKKIESDSEPYVLRLWRPHPRKWTEATSPARAVLAVLSEIDQLTKFIFAQIDSRLAGAGMLLLPSEIQMPGGVMAQAQSTAPEGMQLTASDVFSAALQDAMVESLGDRESASAVVPIVATVPGQYISDVKHITFWSELQEQAKSLRDEAIRRMALGMDLPPEVITGTADVNHWTAWQVDEAAIKAHAEPLLAMITESLTTGYLRPLLVADGLTPEEAEAYSIEADTAQLRLRPNRSTEAFELYDRGQLSNAALLREVGFDATDAPDPDELREWFIRKVAQGSTTPELVAAALRALGVGLGAGDVGEAGPAEARPTPSLTDHPRLDPPDPDEALVAAAEVIVYRALERAGNRLKTRIGKPVAPYPAAEVYRHVPVSSGQLDYLLEDAFTNLERYGVCARYGTTPVALALDTYCRALLVNSAEHDPRLLHDVLARAIAAEPRAEAC